METEINWSVPQDFKINNYYLKMTCYACPEQYDVFNRAGKQVGYLRLRHGHFSVSYPECGGKIIYKNHPNGDGMFDDNEREHFIRIAVREIEKVDEQSAIDMLIEKE